MFDAIAEACHERLKSTAASNLELSTSDLQPFFTRGLLWGDRFSQKLSGHASTDNLSQLTIEISHRRTSPILTDKLNTARPIDLFP